MSIRRNLETQLKIRRFLGFRKEVEHVSVNQKPGQPSWFSDWLENMNLVDDVEILLPVKFV